MLWVHIRSAIERHFYKGYPQHMFHGEMKKRSILLDWKKHIFLRAMPSIWADPAVQTVCSWSAFVCVEVLQPGQPIRVILSMVSLPNHTFSGKGLVPEIFVNVVVQIIFSSILHIWYVEAQITRSISENPLDFEITRVDCTLFLLWQVMP